MPVLVERLRSALELSCSSQSSEDALPLEDSGVDSEEDLRMWASGLCNTLDQKRRDQSPRPLDLKFLEDLLLSDIQTALSRLQETLRKVDASTLAKYNSSLDSTNKLHLLRLISNLLSRLKIPDELIKDDERKSDNIGEGGGGGGNQGNDQGKEISLSKRRRGNRHTIGVSAEEIAEARKLLDEKLLSEPITADINKKKNQQIPSIMKKAFDKPHEVLIQKSTTVVQNKTDIKQGFDKVEEKHVKDAINQQNQTLLDNNNINKKEYLNDNYDNDNDENDDNLLTSFPISRTFQTEHQFSDDHFQATNFYHQQQQQQQQPAASKYNKFVSKKSKIKRANTIDIPNYLKLQAESLSQGALRRPIEIGDKITSGSGNGNIIPAFKPRTESDRKFLALINKNNETATNTSNPPFRSFNYRQSDNVDRNWNSRFSNIKTTFDKPPSQVSNDDVICRTHPEPQETEGVVVGSLRLTYNAQPRQKTGGFTHAPTSPFQRIEKPSSRMENGNDNGNGNGNGNASIFKSGYLPQGGGSSLMARVKIFNKEEPAPSSSSIVARNKNKFNRLNEHQVKTDSNKEDARNTGRSYFPGNRGALSSKLIVNANSGLTERPEQPKLSNARTNYVQTEKERAYVGGFSAPRGAEIPARSSSHSFMMQKIANDNNPDNRPRVARYVNEALRLKEPDEAKDLSRNPLGPISHSYSKPVAPRENYPVNKTPGVFSLPLETVKRNDVKNEENQRGNYEMSKEFTRESFVHQRLNQNTGQNFIPGENEGNKKNENFKTHRVPHNDNVERNTASLKEEYLPVFPKPSSSSSSACFDGYLVPASSNDNSSLHKVIATPRMENLPQSYPGKVAKYSDYHSMQDYVPYQSYQQTKRESEKPKENRIIPEYDKKAEETIYGSSWNYERDISSTSEEDKTISVNDNQSEISVPRSMIDLYREKQNLLEDENIQNQDISSEGIVTRYQCAIATVATTPESSEPDSSEPQRFQGLKEEPMKLQYNVEICSEPVVEESIDLEASKEEERNESAAFDEIQRHNLLQQQIIQQLKSEENRPIPPRRRKSLDKFQWEEKPALVEHDRRSLYIERPSKNAEEELNETFTTPSYYFPLSLKTINQPQSPPAPAPAERKVEEPVIESNNTLEKINIFEEKSLRPLPSAPIRQRFRPLSIPKFDKLPRDFPPGKVNVVTPSKAEVKLKSESENSPIISSSTNIIDSSDEYLMSCANRQSRSIVLSKSESWHQLALSRGNLQPPQSTIKPLLKPPKPKSPASVRLSKQYEAPTSSDSMKRMEEKIQRYFNGPIISGGEVSALTGTAKRESGSKSKRHFTSKKNHLQQSHQGSSGLARSQTMPHLYDDKLLDDNTDVEKAFDSLFKEAIKSDNRY